MKKPEFPQKYLGEVNAFPYAGGICVPNLIASIPTFTLYNDPEERERREKEYWEVKKSEYEEGKAFYETLTYEQRYYGGNKDVSMRISKISLKGEAIMINMCASPEHKEYAKQKGLKPVKPMRMQLEVFHSLFKSNKLKLLNREAENGIKE